MEASQPSAADLVPEHMARLYGLVPLSFDGTALRVAAVAVGPGALGDLAHMLGFGRVEVELWPPERVAAALDTAYPAPPPAPPWWRAMGLFDLRPGWGRRAGGEARLLVRLAVLNGLRWGADAVRLARDGPRVTLVARRAGRDVPLVPPEPRVADAAAWEVAKTGPWPWPARAFWGRLRGRPVPAPCAGRAGARVGAARATVRWAVHPRAGGVEVDLTLEPGPGAREAAAAVLRHGW